MVANRAGEEKREAGTFCSSRSDAQAVLGVLDVITKYHVHVMNTKEKQRSFQQSSPMSRTTRETSNTGTVFSCDGSKFGIDKVT